MDFAAGVGRVMGKGTATLCYADQDVTVPNGEAFDLALLGAWHAAPPPAGFVPEHAPKPADAPAALPDGAADLLEQRRVARANQEWPRSDALREQLAALGVVVQDTKQGQQWTVVKR